MINVLREAGEIVFEDEEAEEFRIAQLDGDVPGQHDGEVEEDAGDPEGAEDGSPVALYGEEDKEDNRRQGGRDRTLGQRRQRQREVEGGEINVAAALVPGVPGEQSDGEAGGERHVGGGGVGETDYGRATGGDEGAIEFAA